MARYDAEVSGSDNCAKATFTSAMTFGCAEPSPVLRSSRSRTQLTNEGLYAVVS